MKKYATYLYTLIIIALGGLYIYFPEWGELITLAIGVAVCALVYTRGFISAISPIFLVALLFYAIKGDWVTSAFILVGFLIPPVLAAITLKRGFSLRGVMAAVSLGYLAEMFAGFFMVKITQGINIFEANIDLIKEFIQNNQDQIFKSLKDMGSQDTQALRTQLTNMTIELFRLLTPAFIVISACIMAYIVVSAAVALLRWHGEPLENIMPFHKIRGSSRLATMLGIAYIISRITGDITSGLFTNISFLLMAYFAVCGLAVADFYLVKRSVKCPLRLLIYIAAIALTSWFGIFILLIVGTVDAVFDIRKLRIRGEPHEK